MKTSIELTKQEHTLREFLLDVSEYIASLDGYKRPELRFTGGWVRDKLLGNSSKDIDIAISSTTGCQFAAFMKEFVHKSPLGLKYGSDFIGHIAKIKANPEQSKHLETANTKILGLDIDLVNLRKETYFESSRTPSMEFGTPEEDALRRDATVNALFFNLTDCQVEDFTGHGIEDMKLGIIRTPMDPYQTFKDDPLRVLRCIRFASKLGFSIDPKAENCMSDQYIQESLCRKIRRERVGIEIDKIFKGPRPHQALSLINRLGLFETVFTDPNVSQRHGLEISCWPRAFDVLRDIIGARDTGYLRTIGTLLDLHEDQSLDNLYQAWLLCALAPWARVGPTAGSGQNSKQKFPVSAMVARESLKIDNKNMKIIKDATLHFQEIIESKNAFSKVLDLEPATKRKQEVLPRDTLGMCIRKWGAHWRSSAVLAILVDIMEVDSSEDIPRLLGQYAKWLENLRQLELLEAYALKPIVDGKMLMKALGKSGGPWLAVAIDTAMEWQLRNPAVSNPEEAIAEVVSNYKS